MPVCFESSGVWLAFIVNSSPGAGLRFEPSASFPDPKTALGHAERLGRRGMRMIRIVNSESGEVFEESTLRAHIASALAPRDTET